ncbi:uncharacterized protein [Hoplias malabaricus]|uniref:uncharacterized protein n=1 Tax=Hoplias malabaricus TaxID=27720 RepID=UPI00346351C5
MAVSRTRGILWNVKEAEGLKSISRLPTLHRANCVLWYSHSHPNSRIKTSSQMDLNITVLGRHLRPVVLCAAGLSAAAATSYLLFSGYRRIVGHQRETRAVIRPHALDGSEYQELNISAPVCVSIPKEVSMQNCQTLPFSLPGISGPLARIKQRCQDLDRANRIFAFTYSRWCSDYRKLVEVKLEHQAIYRGLETEHWWVLSNKFYLVDALELPPRYFAHVRAVACIKRTGTCISEAKIYLRSESSDSSVQNTLLQTNVSITFKGVSIDEDGRFRAHESNDAQTLETPALSMFSRPRGPPPGF